MPMQSSEYACIRLSNTPHEFIDEYNLTKHTCNGWLYLDILKGCYGLPQAGKLANDISASVWTNLFIIKLPQIQDSGATNGAQLFLDLSWMTLG